MQQHPTNLIHDKIVELAAALGTDATGLRNDQVIPGSGYLDSAAIMEFILWLEQSFDLLIPQEDLSIQNFGTVDAIADYVRRAAS
jgi:acyl carrier protein